MNNRCLSCMKKLETAVSVCPYCGSAVGEETAGIYLKPGTYLQYGRYLVGSVLGSGSFGTTYIGLDETLERTVAIKEYFPGAWSTRTEEDENVIIYTGESEEFFEAGKQKFLEEASRMLQFSQEKEIVHIYDWFEENSTAYIVMEYLDGETLKSRLDREGRIPPDEAVEIIRQVLQGLSAIHRCGMLHRDVAADNIRLLRNGGVKLFDFGAARQVNTGKSRSLTVAEKAGYTPPEQYQSHGDQGPWTDVYSAAATLYEMLTGELPLESMERIISDSLLPPSKKGVKLKKSVEHAILNALNLDINKRTPSAEKFLEELFSDEVRRVADEKRKNDSGKISKSMKIIIGIVAGLVGVYLILVAAGIVRLQDATADRVVIEEGMARVPNLVNLPLEEAEARADEAGFVLMVEKKEFSDTIPVNRILSQSVPAGAVSENTQPIRLTLSAGIEQTYVPDFVGLSRETAEELCLSVGLLAEFEEESSFIAPGYVVSQSSSADTVLDTGSLIRLSVSSGTVSGKMEPEIPLLKGKSWEDALALSEKNGFYLGRSETVMSETLSAGTILDSVDAGAAADGKKIILVRVSSGREKVSVPDVQYLTEEEAKTGLQQAGLAIKTEEVYNNSVKVGSVIRQSPEADARVEKGTEILITVSLGTQPQIPETTAPMQTVPQTTAQPRLTQSPVQTAAPETQPQTAAPETQPPETTAAPLESYEEIGEGETRSLSPEDIVDIMNQL